jgi:GMP synthase PP-ATPase subunit
MMEYEDLFSDEIRILNEIISLADKIASRINAPPGSKTGLHGIVRVERLGGSRNSVEPW